MPGILNTSIFERPLSLRLDCLFLDHEGSIGREKQIIAKQLVLSLSTSQFTAKIVHAAWFHWILSFLLGAREWSDFFLRTTPSKMFASLLVEHLTTSSLGCFLAMYGEPARYIAFLLGRSLVILGIGEPQKFWTSMMSIHQKIEGGGDQNLLN